MALGSMAILAGTVVLRTLRSEYLADAGQGRADQGVQLLQPRQPRAGQRGQPRPHRVCGSAARGPDLGPALLLRRLLRADARFAPALRERLAAARQHSSNLSEHPP